MYKNFLFILVKILLLTTYSFAGLLKIHPTNPAFSEWKKQFQGHNRTISDTKQTDIQKTGLIPSPLGANVHSKTLQKSGISLLHTQPSKYDMRDPNGDGDFSDSLLTPIKDQVYGGPCWAFGTYSTLEGYIVKHYGAQKDFSEDHLTHAHGYDLSPTEGGNYYMSMAYLARGKGPIRESDDPYDTFDSEGHYLPNALTPCTECRKDHYVEETVLLPVRNSHDDIDYIKEALLAHGPLFTSMQVTHSSYDPESYSFYYHDYGPSTKEADHGIAIVGWDDNYLMHHKGKTMTGAFIIKNSWGKAHGEDGYYYVAYQADSLAFVDLGYFADKLDWELPLDDIYQHDPLGVVLSIDSPYAANVFTAKEDETLIAISTGVIGNCDINVTVYGEVDDNHFSNPVANTYVPALEGGYRIIKFDTPVSLHKGEKFAVAIHYEDNTGENPYVVPVEYPFKGYSSAASANAGESYLSNNGERWKDLTKEREMDESNVCIKAYVSRAKQLHMDSITDVNIIHSSETAEYTLILASPQSFKLYSSGDFDTKVTLSNSRGEIWLENDNFNNSQNFYVESSLLSGIYHVSFSLNNEETGSFPVHLESISPANPSGTVPTYDNVVKLYVATFDRAADEEGLHYWLNSDLSLNDIAKSFFEQEETKEKYPDTLSNTTFIQVVYQNLFTRDAEQEGLNYWVAELDNNSISRSELILAVINGAQGEDATILTNKSVVGEYFAKKGLNNIEDAYAIMAEITSQERSARAAIRKIDELSLSAN